MQRHRRRLRLGLCTGGLQVCSSGAFGGPCVGQITPAVEQCNNLDDDCDAAIDENVVQACYTGPGGTQNVGVIDVDPATAANSDDVVFVAWEDHREGAQVYMARSANAGGTFSAAVRASNAAGAAVTGTVTVPKLVFAGSNLVVIAYQKTVSGVAHVFAASSIDGGVTWHFTDPQIDAGAGPATSPVIARFDSASAPTIGALIAWIDFRTSPGINGDPMRVRYAR